MARRTVSLITTVLNEEKGIEAFLRSLLDQTRQPDEIVICDAGSRDATVNIIRSYLEDGFPARLIIEKGANRARGRNLAIEESKGEIIACTDAGCIATMDWLANLVAPFEEEHPPEVAAGYYAPEAHQPMEEAIAVATVPTPPEVDPETFLPSARSVAFTREAWQRVGGFPEFVDYAEDTHFDLNLKAAGCRFRFVPEALVRWRMQAHAWDVFRQFLRYAKSDGELGHWFGHYTKAYAMLAATVLLLALAQRGSTAAAVLWVALFAAYWARYTVRARRRGAEWEPAFLAPSISLVIDLAHLLGYSFGSLKRRPRAARLPTDRPLSVAQVTYTYQPITGGADVYVSQLAELLAAAGHGSAVYQRASDMGGPNVTFVPNALRGRPLEFWTQAFGLFGLRRQLRAHDVAICHYPHYLLALDLLSFWARRPVRVGLSHGVFWDDAPGAPKSFLKAWLARLAFRRAHLYVANDTHFLRAMGLKIEPREGMHSRISPGVWFIPNGVDTAEFAPSAPVPEIADRNAILVPRNLFRNRGVHLAIEAFAQFHPRHPETTLYLVGGGGQPRYVESLHQEVEARGLRNSVVFQGSVPHDALPAIYSSAQLTLIPTLCGEGTSLSALESMACGVATICTYVAGLRDLPGPHCLPMVSSLVEVMEEVWPNRKEVAETQRRIVLERYSLERWAKAWREALREVGVGGMDAEGPL